MFLDKEEREFAGIIFKDTRWGENYKIRDSLQYICIEEGGICPQNYLGWNTPLSSNHPSL